MNLHLFNELHDNSDLTVYMLALTNVSDDSWGIALALTASKERSPYCVLLL